jgi:hypothetical protein
VKEVASELVAVPEVEARLKTKDEAVRHHFLVYLVVEEAHHHAEAVVQPQPRSISPQMRFVVVDVLIQQQQPVDRESMVLEAFFYNI